MSAGPAETLLAPGLCGRPGRPVPEHPSHGAAAKMAGSPERRHRGDPAGPARGLQPWSVDLELSLGHGPALQSPLQGPCSPEGGPGDEVRPLRRGWRRRRAATCPGSPGSSRERAPPPPSGQRRGPGRTQGDCARGRWQEKGGRTGLGTPGGRAAVHPSGPCLPVYTVYTWELSRHQPDSTPLRTPAPRCPPPTAPCGAACGAGPPGGVRS